MGADVDIAVVGAGAAGLMAAIQAGRAGRGQRIVAVDGAERLGAKIRISGGGRCNVTHDVVDEHDFAGASPKAIRKVLLGYDVAEVRAFFAELGVALKREETGKLFPVTDRATTVLEALLRAAEAAGVELWHPFRVDRVSHEGGEFTLTGPQGVLRAARVVLAAGGRSVPTTGSDGKGYELATSLGHTLTEKIVPALVPLLLPEGHPLTTLRGISAPVALDVITGTGKRSCRVEGSLLLTHFGLSGPAALDVSRHWILAHDADARVTLRVSWLPGESERSAEEGLRTLGRQEVLEWLSIRVASRLAHTLMSIAGVGPHVRGDALTRELRRSLASTLTGMVLPVVGPRGWAYAEVTAGGVPLREVILATMASRTCPGLHLCGEIFDVDGRIGGFNFQWAWASGTLAGRAAASSRRG